MIHSLAGGDIRGDKFFDFAKVEILDGESKGDIRWYTFLIFGLEVGDIVVVPNGYSTTKAKVLQIDRKVSSFSAPIPPKHAKEILYKLEVN